MKKEYKSKSIFKVILTSIILFCSFGCTSYTHYFIDNSSKQSKSIVVQYHKSTSERQELLVPPDSLLLTKQKDFPNKPHKWYKNIDHKKNFIKINDSIYRMELSPNEKIMIPYRFAYINSIQRISIDQQEEIIFLNDFENETLKYYRTKNLKPQTSIDHHYSFFNEYFLIEFKE